MPAYGNFSDSLKVELKALIIAARFLLLYNGTDGLLTELWLFLVSLK